MIFNIEPVTNIQTIPVNRKRPVMERIDNHQRNELFREMIRSIVIRAARNCDRKSVCPVVGHDKEISPSLGTAVRTRCMDGRFFCKEKIRTIQRKIAIHFIGRYLVIPLNAILSAGIHQDRRPDNIRLKEDFRIFNGTINMAFCSEINHDIRLFFFKKAINAIPVTNIHLYELEIRMIHDICQC